MDPNTVKQYATTLPEGYAIVPSQPTNAADQIDLEVQGSPLSLFPDAAPPELKPAGDPVTTPQRYAAEIPEGFIAQTDNIFEGVPQGQTTLSSAPPLGVIDRAKKAVTDFFTGGEMEDKKRADLVYVLAQRNRLPIHVVDQNLEAILANPKMSGLQQEIPQDLKAGSATVQSFAESVTFGAFDPDPYLKTEFPIQSAVGAVSGGVVTFLATGGVLQALGLGKRAYDIGQAGRAIHAAAPRFLPAALMTGSTFATVEGIRQAVDQVERKKLDPLKLGSETLTSFAEGASLGAVGQAVGPVRRVFMAGGLGYISGQARGYTKQESAIQGAIWGGIEAFGGIGRDKALKDRALVDIRDQLAKYAQKKKPGMPSDEARVQANEYINKLANGDIAGAMKSTPIQFLERAARKVAKMIKDWKGTKHVNVLEEAAKDLSRPRLPGETQGTGTGVLTETVLDQAKLKAGRLDQLNIHRKYYEQMGNKEAVARLDKLIAKNKLSPEEQAQLDQSGPAPQPAPVYKSEKDEKIAQLEIMREHFAKTGEVDKVHKIDLMIARARLDGGEPPEPPQTKVSIFDIPTESGSYAKGQGNKPHHIQPDFSEVELQALEEVRGMSSEWKAGGDLAPGKFDNGRMIRLPSTFPNELKDIGLTHRHLNTVFNNIEKGKPLTLKQIGTVKMLLEWRGIVEPINKEIEDAAKGLTESETKEVLAAYEEARSSDANDQAVGGGLEGAGKEFAAVEIPDFKNTDEAVQFGIQHRDNPAVLLTLKAKREEMLAAGRALSEKEDATPAEEAQAFQLIQQAQFPREAIEAATGKINPEALKSIQKNIEKPSKTKPSAKVKPNGDKAFNDYLAQGKPAAGQPDDPKKPGKFTPMKTSGQLKREAKKKMVKQQQKELGEIPYAANTVAGFIRQRRANIDLGNYETNLFINAIEQRTTRQERELVPFLIEKTDVPPELGRPDLESLWSNFHSKDSELGQRLGHIVEMIREHFDTGWKFMQENVDNLTAAQIEDYVTHIWLVNPKKKSEITNAFIVKNRFLKRRFIETYKQGIQDFGLKPRTLDISEIIRVHDNIMHKTVANAHLVKSLMRLRHGGVPLLERADRAPLEWVLFNHPALTKAMVIPGDPEKGERVTEELHRLLNELGLAIGKRIAPTIFGRPAPLGQYWHTEPPEIRLQRFFSTRTLAHEIGHFIDFNWHLNKAGFTRTYRDEIYALNRERIARLSKMKGSTGKYKTMKEYAESEEEMIAEFFAFLFTDFKKAKMLAPNATQAMLEYMSRDGNLTKLANFDFETRAKLLIAEQMNLMIRLPVRVHPDLEKPLRVVFDERSYHPIVRSYEMIQGTLKKAWLSLSLFHHVALGETAIATMGIKKTAEIAFNFPKIYDALAKGQYDVYRQEEAAKKWITRGLQVGATADIPVHRIQQSLNDFASKTKNTPVLGRMADFVATFNEVWDKALWNYYHDTLKLFACEHLAANIDPQKSRIIQEQEIAQLVNDTFGGQNWDVLMTSPKVVQIMSWALLSPDWFISTMRQAMAFTGAGAIHNRSKPLRAKLGQLFWLKAFLYFGVGINLLNAVNRLADKKKNPQHYKDKKNLIDYTMWGNNMGHKTHLFMGRYRDGTERYGRWGKQFRELPEMLIDDTGFNPITASMRRVGAKVAPIPQTLSMILTGHSLSGYRNRDIAEAEGWDRVWNTFLYLLKSPFPFSARNVIEKDREYHLADIAMPSSRGMTRYKAMRFFKIAIERGDDRLLKEVWQDALDNNLPPETLFKAAMSSLKAEGTKERNSHLKTVKDVEKALANEKDPAIIKSMKARRKRLQKEAREIEQGTKLLDRAIQKLNNPD